MRSQRAVKFSKQKKTLVIIIEIFLIGYTAVASASFFTSSTGAYINDTEQDEWGIQLGEWYDGSILDFIGNGNQNIKTEPPTDISVVIKNNGFSMIGSAKYEVYYSENGNPEQNGEKIGEGTIEPIAANETATLTFHAEKFGTYMFKAIQRTGFEDPKNAVVWSEKVMVKNQNGKEPNNATVNEEKTPVKENDTSITEEKVIENQNIYSEEKVTESEATTIHDATLEETPDETTDNKQEQPPEE